MDLLIVHDRKTGRFIYTEQLERRGRETSWKYARRIVRREGRLRNYYDGETLEVVVVWGISSVEELLESYPEYGLPEPQPGDETTNRTYEPGGT